MKQATYFNLGLCSFVAAPVLLLLLLLFFHWDSIERKVATNANDSLAINHAWAKAETFNRGRDVIIIGTAPDQRAADDAIQIVMGAPGVRKATFAGYISPSVAPARVEIVFGANDVILKGALASPANINNLVATASDSFSPRKIVNQLEVVENTSASRDLTAVFEAIKAIRSDVKLAVNGTTLTVAGVMPDEQSSRSLVQMLSENFDGKVVSELQLAPVDPNKLCQDKLDKLLSTLKINFAVRESKINPESFALLRKLAEILRNCSTGPVQIVGHTDTVGSAEFNMLLSEQRAASVIKYFTDLGLDATRFQVVGYGSSKPIADNGTEAGRAANRRIEIIIKI